MHEYENLENPVFSEKLSVFDETDPAHADVLNTPAIQTYENTIYNRENIKAVNVTIQAQIQDALNIAGSLKRGMDGIEQDMFKMEMMLATLMDADSISSDNAVIETFADNNDVIMVKGAFDSVNKCVYA